MDPPKGLAALEAAWDARPTRRTFLIGAAAAAGGLVVGLRPLDAARASETAAASPANPLIGYIRITPDNRVTVLSSQFDMGQGVYHGIATLVVEELEADWSQVDVQGAAGDVTLYGNILWGGTAQGTGGSTSMATSWERYRKAGAAARAMLVAAAAEAWDVPGDQISVAAGVLSHPDGRRASFGDMAGRAAEMAPPQDPPLKARGQWSQIGNEALRRFDSAGKTNGSHRFTIDVALPGMLTAVVAHPPRFGARVASFDAGGALAVKGVTDVVQIPRGVAVVAESTWAALKGREALSVAWDESEAETRGSREILDTYHRLASEPPKAIARAEGDAAGALASSAQTLEASYEFPYLAHAALEPMNAIAAMSEAGELEVWGGHQIPTLYQYIAAQIAELPPERVRLHVMTTGGSFGRRAVADGDVVAEAVAVAKAIGWRAPVKVQWTREDDMAGGRYRPAYVHRLRAGLDEEGNLVAWENHIVGQSILAGTPFEAAMVQNGIDYTSVEGASNLPYAVPNLSVGLTSTDVGVPVLWWRAVGSTHTAFAVEAFIDELAAAAGKDPYAFRMAMLADHPRHRAVLQTAAEKAGWAEPLPEGRHRGLALHESFGSVVAHVVELAMEGGAPVIHRVVAAVECGTVVNPDVVRAQIEGGTAFGLGAIMAEELTLEAGRVQETNYDAYTPLRIDQAPAVEVHIVPSDARPSGVGEPGLPSIGPAVANAIAAATGRRVRQLPIRKALDV
ncbi:MAG: xanthine dehydrogenase family protein molybdopterin-binding subunit [Alphaproteobacteria bacterium]|nr:xanthine dehydrogenase family protein molybdopterin-binding subunit [Alphaproteobacteria bacterium]